MGNRGGWKGNRRNVWERTVGRCFAAPNGCWEWTGSLDAKGYPTLLAYDGKRLRPYQIVYTLFHGPVPEGLELDHLCRNPKCCNPWHLEAVDGWTNRSRGVSPPALLAKRTHCNNGHPFEGDNLIVTATGRKCRTCKREADRVSNAKRLHDPRYREIRREGDRRRYRARKADAK